MFGELRAQAWKLGTFASAAVGVAVAATLGFHLLAEKAETARLTTANGRLTRQIEDPDTGYIARLAQCRTNVKTLEGDLADQTSKVKRLGEDSARKLAAAEARLAETRAETARLQARAAATLAHTPIGADSCARMDDVRRRYLEGLR